MKSKFTLASLLTFPLFLLAGWLFLPWVSAVGESMSEANAQFADPPVMTALLLGWIIRGIFTLVWLVTVFIELAILGGGVSVAYLLSRKAYLRGERFRKASVIPHVFAILGLVAFMGALFTGNLC